jgi:hypothetical protein
MGGAVLQNSTVAMYSAVYYFLSISETQQQEGRGAVLRTLPYTSYYHESISEAQIVQ